MIAIVTDSTVGYSTADIASRGVVRVVPVNYQIGECLFEEGALDKNGEFLRRMQGQSVCKTAQPALTEFIRAFRTLTEKGYDVICIVLSSALSGTWSSARVAAAQAGGRIPRKSSPPILPASAAMRFYRSCGRACEKTTAFRRAAQSPRRHNLSASPPCFRANRLAPARLMPL